MSQDEKRLRQSSQKFEKGRYIAWTACGSWCERYKFGDIDEASDIPSHPPDMIHPDAWCQLESSWPVVSLEDRLAEKIGRAHV